MISLEWKFHEKRMRMFKKYTQMIRDEFKGYNQKKLKKDFLAGLTVAAVALPLALAFGVSSGATAAAGMITAIIAGIVIGSLSGGFYQISGPTGAMAAILMSIAAMHGMQGILLATFLAGIFLLLAGILRLGSLTSFIPSPVITGFTSGIAIIIALGQLDNFFGVRSEGHNLIEKISSYRSLGFDLSIPTTVMSILVVLGLVFFPKKWNGMIPASLVMIILATLATVVFQLPVATVGKIPTSIFSDTRLELGSLQLSAFQDILVPSISIAMLGMIESLLCGASAGRMTGKPLDSNQELVAQGIGNLILPFFGGVPATAAIARTSVVIKSGAQTRLAGIFHAVFLLLSMLLLSPVMSKIPMPALAGVLVVTAWRMNEWSVIKEFFQKRFHTALCLFFLTMIATVIFDLSLAIVLGVLAGCLFFIAKSAVITINVEEVDWSRMGLVPTDCTENWVVVYLSDPLFFMSSDRLKQTLLQLETKSGVVFSMRGVPSIDSTALDILEEFCLAAEGRGQQVQFAALQPEVEKMIRTIQENQEKEYHFSVAEFLQTVHITEQ
ncbi:TPA: SulP family inorganic anion transporter [Enterococcus faecalis]|uniref:SulP family inorganic anion transporter n=1 Tax=Enterococcus faecalis TaxID=1351 RepID=UPI00046C5104|nr:SulP family inorganic anion transporter [Enterococcus faecalis]HAP2960605.1 SulP family inorganic anion transporter [Enterococcus faecalis]HAP3074321.1 SulP family inorganic anion transporter [Enterococcus faecalis]